MTPDLGDLYGDYNFRVKFDGRCVAGFSQVSVLKRTTEAGGHRVGGQDDYEPITFSRGISYDAAFQQWANFAYGYVNPAYPNQTGSRGISLEEFRRGLRVELYTAAGQVAAAYDIQRAWVSEYRALPELDANSKAVAVDTMLVQHEGWERDGSLNVSLDPDFVPPAS